MSEFKGRSPEVKEFEEKVVQISRVTKKTKGGNKMGFSVLMVVGDKKGKVGIGLGKAPDVVSAIKKGVKKAKRKMILVPMDGTTLPFKIELKEGAGRVLLKPAAKGSGVIAGGPVRALVEAAGIRDISAKILGSDNQASSVYAAFAALKKIEQIVALRGIKLRSIIDIEREEKEKLKQLQEKAKATAQQSEDKAPVQASKAKAPAKSQKAPQHKEATGKKASAPKAETKKPVTSEKKA